MFFCGYLICSTHYRQTSAQSRQKRVLTFLPTFPLYCLYCVDVCLVMLNVLKQTCGSMSSLSLDVFVFVVREREAASVNSI